MPEPLKILLVDDEDSFRMSIEVALRMYGTYTVTTGDCGEAAVEALQRESFDVVILDNRMPDMSGLEVMQWMQSHKIDTPVIMVTAAGSEEVVVDSMKLGAFDYLRKDLLDVDRLVLSIHSVHEQALFRRKQSEREAEETLLGEKRRAIGSLQMFHQSVLSVGALVEQQLTALAAVVSRYEGGGGDSSPGSLNAALGPLVREIRHKIGMITSGVQSMQSISTVVTAKLHDIQKED